MRFPDKEVRDIASKVNQTNGYYAHPENVLVGMLGSPDLRDRKIAVERILNCRSNSSQNLPSEGVRKFYLPKINMKAKRLADLSDLFQKGLTEPPLTKSFTNEEIEKAISTPIVFEHPCHSQAVERHVRLVSNASASVSSFERRDGLIRQQIKSHSLIKTFDTKKQFVLE